MTRLGWPGAAIAVALLAGCTPSHGDELPTSSSVHAYRSHGEVVATVGTLAVKPGQAAVFDTYIVNDSGHPVRVTGAKLATVPGRRKPRLTNVALVTGRNGVGIQNWPPVQVRLRPLVGHELPRGRSDIAVGIAGLSPGTSYPAAGVTLTIRDHGRPYQATAWGGGVACVVKRIHSKQTEQCSKISDAEITKIGDYIHQQ